MRIIIILSLLLLSLAGISQRQIILGQDNIHYYRPYIILDTLQLNQAEIVSDSDSGFVYDRTTKRVVYAKINGGGSATTLYTGDGTVAGNRDVNVNNLNLTFSDANTFRVNYDMYVQSKANATIPYTSVIGLTAGNYWQFAHTPSAGSFTRGNGIIVDTLNNVGLGDLTQTTMPLYNIGNSTYIASGLQSRQGNFYAVTTKSTTGSISLGEYFVLIDASGGNITLTLPAASTAFGAGMGIQYVFKRVDNSGNTISIARAGSDTIDGATSMGLTAQYEVKELQCSSTSTWSIK